MRSQRAVAHNQFTVPRQPVSMLSAMERERFANPARAGEQHRVAYALVEGRAYVADGESVEMWARFDAEGYLWLDIAGTMQPRASYPVGGESSVVQRIEPILFA